MGPTVSRDRLRSLLFLLVFSHYCTAVSHAQNSSASAPVLIGGPADPLAHWSENYIIGKSGNGMSELLRRATSQDPSCPDGFLCIQEACPSGVICPSGMGCFNFEGTIACGFKNQQVCSLNPMTLEAVGCENDRICWWALPITLNRLHS